MLELKKYIFIFPILPLLFFFCRFHRLGLRLHTLGFPIFLTSQQLEEGLFRPKIGRFQDNLGASDFPYQEKENRDAFGNDAEGNQ